MSSAYREKESSISANRPPTPSNQFLLISAVSEDRRVREACTIFPSIKMTEVSTVQLLSKLKQLGWNQGSSAFWSWISQSLCLCFSPFCFYSGQICHTFQEAGRVDNCGEKALLQTCCLYFCKDTFVSGCSWGSFSLLLGARNSNLTPVVALSSLTAAHRVSLVIPSNEAIWPMLPPKKVPTENHPC